ncbi:MAG: Ig-like domain-containing protein [Woeseiaceae bacterium]|nr:Ig-like domain-containing protein [Woeseiaceae bacterium]
MHSEICRVARHREPKVPTSALLAVMTLVLPFIGSCSSGSFDSDVGKRPNIEPVARLQILNGNGSNMFREGAEVFLTGKDSEDGDGPIISWEWSQTGGPTVTLVERNTTTVSFTAPDVSNAKTLTFSLRVGDTDQLTSDGSIDVVILPGQDADKLLSLDLRTGSDTTDTFDNFKVVVALDDGAIVGDTPSPFTLSAAAYLVYPPRSTPQVDCPVDLAEFAGGIPDMTGTGCLVRMLQDLTPFELPAGGTGIEGEWPANAPVPAMQTVEEQIEAPWNRRYRLDVPRLDVADFNQPLIDAGLRNEMLDLFNVHKVRILLQFDLIAPQNQSDATIILTKLDDELIDVPLSASLPPFLGGAAFKNSGTGLPTDATVELEPVLAAIPGRESALSSEVYYRTVDPNNTRTTFNDWLAQAGFTSDANGTLLADAEAGNGEFAHAIYLNNFDLGFGRDMYTRTDEFGNVYSFVDNYFTLEGAIRGLDPIVTVVMEYSPLNDPADTGAQKFVKFFTYVDNEANDGVRVPSMNFDGRGERFTPGNCIACHGGAKPPGVEELVFDAGCGDSSDAACYTWPATNRDGVDITDGNLSATFLPWDLESFLFADTDPAIVEAPADFDGTTVGDELLADHGDFSLAAQEAQLKKLNQAAYSTYNDAQTEGARVLVEHWYGGVDANGMLIGDFDDSTAPPGWQNAEIVPTPTMMDPGATTVNPETAEAIYQDVFAQHCRMCHTNMFEESLRFTDYQKFIAQSDLIEETVFHRGIMPAARQTADRFWVDAGGVAARTLAEEIGVDPALAEIGPQPVAEIAFVSPTAAPGNVVLQPERSNTVRITGENSMFASSYLWSVNYTPLPELTGNPVIAAYQPALVGASSSEASFSPDFPGDYEISLTINEATGVPVGATPAQVMVANFTPQPRQLALTVAQGGNQTMTVRDELNHLCPSAACIDVFGDAPASIEVDVASWDPADGSISLDDPADGRFTITADQPGPINVNLPYSVTDIDAESVFDTIAVSILALTNPFAGDDVRAMFAQTTVDPPGSREFAVDVLGNDSADPAADPLTIDSFTQPANGTVTQNGDDLVYSPDLGFLGQDSFTYVAADSNAMGARTSDPATVDIIVHETTRFATDVVAAFNDFGCRNCHFGTFAPNWADYAEVSQRTESPDQARNSWILLAPTSGHVGSSGRNGPPIFSWNETNDNFKTVLRWIEEGSLDN